MAMSSDEIRRTYLEFFEQQDHRRLPSASLVPAEHDPSALFTVAGMHPLKPYFQGRERPPHPRVTTCQKTFRTVDIDIIGTTTRHLTFFEMLGNFSFGDYFKREAARYAWDLSTEGFGFSPDDIWITVFAGDEELGLGPDEEAIEAWLEIGVPRERIVECPRSENFWQAGPTGPCGPCSELYLDRGIEFGKPDDLPGRRQRAVPRVLEPRVHAVRSEPGEHADAAAGQEHRHRAGSQPAGADPAGHAVGVRDRSVRAADRARRGAVRVPLRPGLPDRPGAAAAGRPQPGDDVPDRRRRRSLQRGSRLRAAPDHAARDPARALARAPAGLPDAATPTW